MGLVTRFLLSAMAWVPYMVLCAYEGIGFLGALALAGGVFFARLVEGWIEEHV